MEIADLYVRVSTDEQASKGYSQRNQEEVLRNYCGLKNITVRKVYYEDHSAKTFNRPSWTKLISHLKKYKYKSNLVLFTKWDRFSRNTGDAYGMIEVLRKLGVEPQAIEQPLDLTVPENKMMLAFYLAAPEVENDRRSINVFNGMRTAKKEGRWISSAPLGYDNFTRLDGTKYIAPVEPAASAMKWIFQELVKGHYNLNQIHLRAVAKGLPCGVNNLYSAIRNPVYCGKIVVPRYKDEEEQLVPGQHEPLITEGLFYKAMDILDKRKVSPRIDATAIDAADQIHLRGFLICPECGKLLSGSASKGRNAYYHYYHCYRGCPVRFKAEEVNKTLEIELEDYFIGKDYNNFYIQCILKAYRNLHQGDPDARHDIVTQVRELNAKLSHSRNLLASGTFDAEDYKIIKKDTEEKIRRLEAQIPDLISAEASLEKDLNVCFSNLKYGYRKYRAGDSIAKRAIIGAVYPANLTYFSEGVRTAKVNDLNACIALINKELRGQKKWTTPELSRLSIMVGDTGFEPVTPCL
ncbi:recombinase family protein [Pedobacter sp. V48]|uniref:recombinase family protein n=1 Tax=Pedobacter sp. V48 TaxID=509635 RepID=UPI000A057BF2|nr:recombinase family protein [Pedobacter sp. V48]